MIDIETEHLATLNEARMWLPTTPDVSTLFRWCSRGVRGVRLESIQIGGRRCTSREALARFAEQLTAGTAEPPRRTTRQKRRAHKRAESELAAAGI